MPGENPGKDAWGVGISVSSHMGWKNKVAIHSKVAGQAAAVSS